MKQQPEREGGREGLEIYPQLQNCHAVQKAYTVSQCSVHSFLSVDIVSNVLYLSNFISKDVLWRMKVTWWTVTAKYEAILFFPDRPNPLTAWCFLYNCASGNLQVWIMYFSINNLFSTHQDVISKQLHLLYWYCTTLKLDNDFSLRALHWHANHNDAQSHIRNIKTHFKCHLNLAFTLFQGVMGENCEYWSRSRCLICLGESCWRGEYLEKITYRSG